MKAHLKVGMHYGVRLWRCLGEGQHPNWNGFGKTPQEAWNNWYRKFMT